MAIRAGYSVNYVNDSFFTAAQNAVVGNAGLSSAKTLTPLNGPKVSSPLAIAPPPFQPLRLSRSRTIWRRLD